MASAGHRSAEAVLRRLLHGPVRTNGGHLSWPSARGTSTSSNAAATPSSGFASPPSAPADETARRLPRVHLHQRATRRHLAAAVAVTALLAAVVAAAAAADA